MRFLHEGFFASLDHVERSLYFFLVLAGDRNGVSFYGHDRICATIEISLGDFIAARNGLIDKDLIAFDGTRFQVLSLPDAPVLPPRRPLVTDDDFEEHDPATVSGLCKPRSTDSAERVARIQTNQEIQTKDPDASVFPDPREPEDQDPAAPHRSAGSLAAAAIGSAKSRR